jgi:hypothetical protein
MIHGVDHAADVHLNPRPSSSKATVAALLVAIIGIGGFILLRPTEEKHASNPEAAGPPPGIGPIAAGTLDGIAWKQFAWSAPGGLSCLQFWAGASSTECGHWDDDASPFATVDGDSPITDGERGAATTVIQGVLDPDVTSVRVVQPVGAHAGATLSTCPCGAGRYELPVFMLPLKKHQTAADANGRYVMIAAFHNETELGRVRVPILNFGYCGRGTCT